jgi:hypothetical protein
MTKIIDLVVHTANDWHLSPPTPDPLIDSDALYETKMVSVLYAPLSPTLAILFDLRTSLNFDDTVNAGLLILYGVSDVRLVCRGEYDLKIWLVDSCAVTASGSLVHLDLQALLWAAESISANAMKARFVVGFVSGIGEIAAEIEDDHIDSYLQTIPSWESQIEVRYASYMSTPKSLK